MKSYCIYCMQPITETNSECPLCGKKQMYDCPAHHLVPGTVLDKHFLVGVALGQGGFGITYIGRDLNLDIKVAIKEYYPNGFVNRSATISPNVTCNTSQSEKDFFETGREKFLDEARILAKFSKDPGIVEVRHFFEENDTAYIVMEYVEGQDLGKYIKENGVFYPEEIYGLMVPIMHALIKVHEKGLIHRDISPDNIRFNNGKLKLLDFGAARMNSAVANKTISVILKPGYAPEEQYRSKGVQGAWTDVYALCATMYKCITGVTPDDAPDRKENDEVKKPSELGIVIGESFEYALMKGMSIRQTERYQSIEELMKGFNGNFTIPITTMSKTVIDEGATVISHDNVEYSMARNVGGDGGRENASTVSEKNRAKKKRKWWILILLILLLLGIVGGAIAIAGSHKKQQKETYSESNTPIPTATNVPKPTATNTTVPTATSVPKPTATNTPIPAATSTPKPTATSTPIPTETNVPTPTITAILEVTSTPIPTATSTPAPTATNTPKPTPTKKPTATPKPKATSTPKPTPTKVPVVVHTHSWQAATCTSAKQCSTCGATDGWALGHSWQVATCTSAKMCYNCRITDGFPLGHSWQNATCTSAKKCSTCGTTEGSAIGHSWQAATCTSAKRCSNCGSTEGNTLGHSWQAATCTSAKKCSTCGTTEGNALGHSWKSATCTSAKKCSTCGATEGNAIGHSWKSATCTSAKKCSNCGATEGSSLGHSWQTATCTSAKKCSTCGTTEGSKLEHKYDSSSDLKCNLCGYERGYWSDWKDGGTIAITGTSTKQVETRSVTFSKTQYRYRRCVWYNSTGVYSSSALPPSGYTQGSVKNGSKTYAYDYTPWIDEPLVATYNPSWGIDYYRYNGTTYYTESTQSTNVSETHYFYREIVFY